jgi:hypothetical protein
LKHWPVPRKTRYRLILFREFPEFQIMNRNRLISSGLFAGCAILALAHCERKMPSKGQGAEASPRHRESPVRNDGGTMGDRPSIPATVAGEEEDATEHPSAAPETAAFKPQSGGRPGTATNRMPDAPVRPKSPTMQRKPAGDSNEPTETQQQATIESPPPVGIRLAPDVRLPVAAMPIDFKISSVAEEARKQIVVDYYREVAQAVRGSMSAAGEVAAPPQQPAAGGPAQVSGTVMDSASLKQAATEGHEPEETPGVPVGESIEDSEDGPTVVITNRPEVEEARKRADWRFKALFGANAYNRMTMNSLIEARLPADAASHSTSGNGGGATSGP